ncbi:hypothetical protein CAEBREN_08409 [Caenorhabditis brenneri]|uniref:Uncharacterized protein n=1 Tax=Caenorhabditis brenneri TaxID=135651 RepID=G0NLT4_CAEBE|nr:hypothetical protein CAEBREN_08409 [Caenorhabditis brenneri]
MRSVRPDTRVILDINVRRWRLQRIGKNLQLKWGDREKAESLEQRFRRHLKGKLYGFDNVDPEMILVIGKQLGVMMSDEVQKAFEKKHSVSTLAGGMIDSWKWEEE